MTRSGLCLATLGVLIVSAASAQAPAPAAFRVISPIFGQLVTFSMPANFVVVSENSNGPSYIREAVLKGETVNRWTQMITVTGAQGLVSGPKQIQRQRRRPLRDRSSAASGPPARTVSPHRDLARPNSAIRTPMLQWQAAAASEPTGIAKPR